MNNIPPSICPDKKEDDMKCIANIVLKRMEKEFPPPPPPSGNLPTDPDLKPGNSITGNKGNKAYPIE